MIVSRILRFITKLETSMHFSYKDRHHGILSFISRHLTLIKFILKIILNIKKKMSETIT